MEMMLSNTYFRKKKIYKFTWQTIDNGRFIERTVMDYVIVEKSALGRRVDMHVPIKAGGGVSDHFLVEAEEKVGLGFRGSGCSAGKSLKLLI